MHFTNNKNFQECNCSITKNLIFFSLQWACQRVQDVTSIKAFVAGEFLRKYQQSLGKVLILNILVVFYQRSSSKNFFYCTRSNFTILTFFLFSSRPSWKIYKGKSELGDIDGDINFQHPSLRKNGKKNKERNPTNLYFKIRFRKNRC